MDQTITKPKSTPKDFFMHLGIIITLYVSTISLLSLLFDAINAAFPDRLDYYVDPYSSSLRWAVASLVIIFPLFILLSWLTNKDIEKDPSRAEAPVRKWLTYLTLFLSGIALVTDLVTLVNTFLGGEITTRFTLKVLAVLIVLGIIFWYYVYDLRKNTTEVRYKQIGRFTAILIVLASLVIGFLVIGSPMDARARRFDMIRVNDLQSLQDYVVRYWQQKGALPKTIGDLNDLDYFSSTTEDPDTGVPYGYKIYSATAFGVCGTFARDNTKDQMGRYYNDIGFKHAAGPVCFDKTIDPQMYPLTVPKTVR